MKKKSWIIIKEEPNCLSCEYLRCEEDPKVKKKAMWTCNPDKYTFYGRFPRRRINSIHEYGHPEWCPKILINKGR